MTSDSATNPEYQTREGEVVRPVIGDRLDAEKVGSLWTQIVGKVATIIAPRGPRRRAPASF